jgi:hypothetical protein
MNSVQASETDRIAPQEDYSGIGSSEKKRKMMKTAWTRQHPSRPRYDHDPTSGKPVLGFSSGPKLIIKHLPHRRVIQL